MARIGYARVSTKDQNLDLQLAELEKAGCEKVYSEHKSGVKARLELTEAIKYLRKGDILVVYKFDRLGRSLSDLLSIISELHEKGVEIMSLKDNIDTSSVSGKLMMHIFASLAEFERDLIVERTQAGRKAAMAKGKKMGRPKLKRNKKAKATAMLYEKNLSIDQIQEQLGIRSKSTVYRYLRMEGFEPTRKIYLRKTKKS
jgi:DNA invertase Pin-like site-specific DNA recombinase|nr:recombinase family protein [uncultured Prevotella sp.]